MDGFLAEMNCRCQTSVIEKVMGVERCASCGKLAGGDAFRAFGDPLPTKPSKRRVVMGGSLK